VTSAFCEKPSGGSTRETVIGSKGVITEKFSRVAKPMSRRRSGGLRDFGNGCTIQIASDGRVYLDQFKNNQGQPE